MKRPLLELADELRAIAATGLHFTEGHFDRERYQKLFETAVRLAALAEDADDPKTESRIRKIYLSSDEGYVTPKLDARMAIFQRDHVLLVQERADSCWSLPGGYVDIGDSPSGAAERETSEEAGIEVRAVRMAGIFDYRLQPEAPPVLFHIHKLIFIGEPLDPEADPNPCAGPEVLDARFFPVDALPELSPGRTLPIHVRSAWERVRNPGLATHFD